MFNPRGHRWLDIGFAYAVSIGFLCVLYPEIFVGHSRRFLGAHDTEIHLQNIFQMASFFSQGGIQLYDRFDGLSNVYNVMTSGCYSVVDMVLAVLYLLLRPFTAHSGILLHDVYSVGYHALTLLLRVLGAYLLLGKFSNRRAAVIGGVVLFNVFCASMMYNRGLMTNTLYSYLPMLFYFILDFFQKASLRSALFALLLLAVAVANSPFLALSYFYVPVHFFILSCAIVFFIYPGEGRSGFIRVLRNHLRGPGTVALMVVMLALVAVIIMPYAMMFPYFNQDFFIANSGLHGTQGRLQSMGIAAYFNLPGRSYVPPADFLVKTFDFTVTQWGSTWMFLGVLVASLALIGAVVSRQILKLPLVWLFVFMISLNFPADMREWPAGAHWINVLTNPFHFLDRSFHMATMLWYFTLPPLVTLGIEALIAAARGDSRVAYLQRLPLCAGLLAGMSLLYIYIGQPVGGYVLSGFGTMVLAIYLLPRPARLAKYAAGLLLFVLLAVDFMALRHYVSQDLDPLLPIKPRMFRGLMSSMDQVVDYQDPLVYPQRIFYRTDATPVTPVIQTFQNVYGEYYRMFPLLERYLRPPSLYEPRPLVLRDMASDAANAAYLQRDGRIVFFAPYAMDKDQVRMDTLLASGFERQVVLLEHKAPGLVSSTQALQPLPPPAEVVREFSVAFKGARKLDHGEFIEYLMPLPDGFPLHVASALFTRDHEALEAGIDGKKLEQAQGYLSGPYYFDVQNVREGALAVSLPKEADVSGKHVTLVVRQLDDITRIWRNTDDVWEFNYKAPRNGWLVFHYPYDPKWTAAIDGKNVMVWRANKYYIAVSITAGEHRVRLSYWPQTPLRILLLVSALLSVMALAFVFVEGFRREH